MTCRVFLPVMSLPLRSTLPPSVLSMPKMVVAISVRPAPTTPATPRISPGHTFRLTSEKP